MDKQDIIREIQRTAKDNGGKPLGRSKFSSETGIKGHEWRGIHWTSWGDALREAGYAPNDFAQPIDELILIDIVVAAIKETGQWPTTARLQMYCRERSNQPSAKTVLDRLGSKSERAAKVLKYCEGREGFDDVVRICAPLAVQPNASSIDTNEPEQFGYVYLMKFGKYYKIGKSNAVGRREYEIGTKLPEALVTVHTIKTDDPDGVERYWHVRFHEKRRDGEWFELRPHDVRAFKRWKRLF